MSSSASVPSSAAGCTKFNVNLPDKELEVEPKAPIGIELSYGDFDN